MDQMWFNESFPECQDPLLASSDPFFLCSFPKKEPPIAFDWEDLNHGENTNLFLDMSSFYSSTASATFSEDFDVPMASATSFEESPALNLFLDSPYGGNDSSYDYQMPSLSSRSNSDSVQNSQVSAPPSLPTADFITQSYWSDTAAYGYGPSMECFTITSCDDELDARIKYWLSFTAASQLPPDGSSVTMGPDAMDDFDNAIEGVAPPAVYYGHHSTNSSIAGALSVSDSKCTRIKKQRSRSKKMPIPVPGLTKKARGRKPPTTGDGSRKHHCYVPGCRSSFERLDHLTRHVNSIHTNNTYICPVPSCGKPVSRMDNLKRHVKTHRSNIVTNTL